MKHKLIGKNSIEFKVGQSYNLEDIKQKLVDLGYERYDLLEGRGGFSSRGGILDISLNNKQGIRIEFWGDEVDSIRKFDIMTQRSEENIESIKKLKELWKFVMKRIVMDYVLSLS